MKKGPRVAMICCVLLCLAALALHAAIRVSTPPTSPATHTAPSDPPPRPAVQPAAQVSPLTADERDRAIVLKLRRVSSTDHVTWAPVKGLPEISYLRGEDHWTYETRRVLQFRVIKVREHLGDGEDEKTVLAEYPPIRPGNRRVWEPVPDRPDVIRGRVKVAYPAPYHSGRLNVTADQYGLPECLATFRLPGSPEDSDEVAKWLKFDGWPGPVVMSHEPFGADTEKPDRFYRDPTGAVRHRDSERLLKGHEVVLARWGHSNNNIQIVVRMVSDEEMKVLKSKLAQPNADPK